MLRLPPDVLASLLLRHSGPLGFSGRSPLGSTLPCLFRLPLPPQGQELPAQIGQLPPEEAWRLPLLALQHALYSVVLLEQKDGLGPSEAFGHGPMCDLPDPILRVARFDVVLEVVRVAAVHPFVLVHTHRNDPPSIAGWAVRKSGVPP